MSSERLFDSASGLRPLSAFLVIGSVLVLVAGRIAWVAQRDEEGASLAERVERSRQQERDLPPAFAIVDSQGRPLALSEVQLDLILSPNAMWQAHTPRKMAQELSAALGGTPGPDELLARMLPDADEGGVIRARNARTGAPLELCEDEARSVAEWVATATLDEQGRPQAIEGIWLERSRWGWQLCWEPARVLDESMRALHMPGHRGKPLAWSRFLADGLARCLLGADALEPGTGVDEKELTRQRDAVWRALLPTTWARAVADFDAACAAQLARTLEEQRVAHHQMRIERGRKRSYPGGRDALLGFWGYAELDEGRRATLVEMGFAPADLSGVGGLERAEQSLDAGQARRYDRRLHEWLAQAHPRTGLERACDRLLADPQWDFLRPDPATFTFLQHRPAALRSRGAPPRAYFLDASEAGEPPRVVTTLDSMLQRFVDEKLAQLMDRHGPAVAMAIVLDVDSAAVLAVGARSPYELSGWAPVHHQFLPGSTFKVPVMAVALDSGAVRPGDRFDVGDGSGLRLPGRLIQEAELSHARGELTAAQCLAQSVNAGLVQIGLKVPAEQLRAGLRRLRYAEAPSTGLGGEREGFLPPLPWQPTWDHASVSFGYRTLVTLWQHAAALAAVVRGGQYLPLRLLDAVEQGGRRWELPRPRPDDVLGTQTCDELRAMMHLGASEGTGKQVVGIERVRRLGMGSKTGTAERVGTEVCVHLELAHQEEHAETGTRCSQACNARVRAAPRRHASACRTLSMAVFGRRPGGGEVFVLVVVDDPVRDARYGSDTAGPWAVAILEEALGETAWGRRRDPVERIAGFRLGATAPEPSSEQPWAEVDG